MYFHRILAQGLTQGSVSILASILGLILLLMILMRDSISHLQKQTQCRNHLDRLSTRDRLDKHLIRDHLDLLSTRAHQNQLLAHLDRLSIRIIHKLLVQLQIKIHLIHKQTQLLQPQRLVISKAVLKEVRLKVLESLLKILLLVRAV